VVSARRFEFTNNCLTMSAAALKSTKRRFSSQNHQNIEFFCLVPRSPTQTGLSCVKTLEPNISSFNKDETEIKCDVSTLILESGVEGGLQPGKPKEVGDDHTMDGRGNKSLDDRGG
jgi:hypothetical protein